MEYISLFTLAALAGSFIPAVSEVYFIYLMQQEHSFTLLLLSASVGNTLGGMTCYFIGRYGGRPLIKKIFRKGEEKLDEWELRLKDKSEWTALFSWLPFVGELLSAVIGLIPGRVIHVTIFMFIGKFLRYVGVYFFSDFVKNNFL